MSTFLVLDSYSQLKRELGLLRASLMKDTSLGHNQLVILYRLSQSSAPLNELAEYTLSDKASTSRTVAALEKSGLVRRVQHEKDKRITIIELTAKGRAKSVKAQQIRDFIGKKVNGTLSASEQKTIANLLNKIVSGLKEQRK